MWCILFIIKKLSKDTWSKRESMRDRESWGDKPYKPDMDFNLCKQSELTDEYGTVEEIFNAMCYYDIKLEDSAIQNSIQLLQRIQKGIPNDIFEKTMLPHKLSDRNGMRKSGTPLQIANLVHHYLDWLRATNKRTWDSRGLNPSRGMLDSCVKGLLVNKYNYLHYDESAER